MLKAAVIYREPLAIADTATALSHVRRSLAPACHAVTLHVRRRALPAELIAAGGFDATLVAALMLWIEKPELLQDFAAPLDALGKNRGVYVLVESTMREYPVIDWRAGDASPGVTLLALLGKRRGLTDREFHEHWQRHSTLSLALHPLTRYLRNAVQRQMGRATPDCDGIVEERVGSLDDLAPERFYAEPDAQAKAVESLQRYVDIAGGGLRCALMDEYLITLPAWLKARASAASPGHQI